MGIVRMLMSRLRKKTSAQPPEPRRVLTSGRRASRTLAPHPHTRQKVAALAEELPGLWRAIGRKLVVGATTEEVEEAFGAEVRERHLIAAFRGYRAFPRDLTISVNDELINTLPSGRRLKAKDLVKIQI